MAFVSRTLRPKRSNNLTVSPVGFGLTAGRGTPTASGAGGGSFDYYIGPSGSDSNAGTLGSPWAITALNDAGKRALYAGRTVGLLDGTYNLRTIMGNPTGGGAGYDTNRLNVAAGSSGSPTIVKAVNRWQAIIYGDRANVPAGTDWEYGLLGPNGSYVTIDGLKYEQAHYRALVNYAAGGDNVIVQNCWFYDQVFDATGAGGGKNSACIFMQNVDNCLIRNCRFELGGAPTDGDRHTFIQFYGSQDCVVEYCTIIGNDASVTGGPSGNCIHFKETANHRMTVRYCYIDQTNCTNTFSDNCIRWHCSGATDGNEVCHHNVIVGGNYAAAIEVEGVSNTWQIYNNTLVGNPRFDAACMQNMETGNPVQTNYYSNILHRTSAGSQGDLEFRSIATMGTLDYNWYNSSPALSVTAGSTYSSFAAWQSASGKETNSASGSNPLFVGTGTDAAQYQLQAGSPCKTLGPGSTEIGAWSSANGGPDAYGIGYQGSRA